MIDTMQYILRADNEDFLSCGSGFGGLRTAIDHVLSTDDEKIIKAGLIERGPMTGSLDEFQGTVIAIASKRPFLDLGERGKLWITREMTTAERVFINHFSDKLAYLDLSQTVVTYASRLSDLKTTSRFKRGFRGLEAAMRGVQGAGYGLIVRRIQSVPGEQVIAAYTSTGYYFTKSADESERQTIVLLRGSMENYGELKPVLPLDDPATRDTLIAAIHCATRVKDPVDQASAFHNILGHIPARLLPSFAALATTAFF